MTTLEKNIEILTSKITNKIGFKITNKETAKELLSNYDSSNKMIVSKFIAKNGVCNGVVYFK